MRKIYYWIFILAIIFGFSADQPSPNQVFKLPQGIAVEDYMPNTLIIKFKDGTALNKTLVMTRTQLSLAGVTLQKMESVFNTSANNSSTFSTQKNNNPYHFENYFRATYVGKQPIEKVINNLLREKSVAYAEPSYVYQTIGNVITPNDPMYSSQFYLSQVHAPEAWNIISDASSVIIGIVDTGSEISHEDLAANIYLNTADPINGIDDDGDGYVDNYYGWDFCGASAQTMIGDNDPNVKSAPADHGVHVSGLASAVSNNGKGVASIANNAKLLIVKAGADDKPTSIYKGYEGVKYAADKGAHIINCSWGGVGGGQFGQEMINYAISKGCLVIAAAGNSANDIPIYPAAFEGVLSVANLESDDRKGQYSNYGTYVDISAPGQGMLNTVFNNSYGYKSGTSMASPLVASAAALVKARFPNLTGLQIGELLRATADNIDSKNPAYIGLLGKGRMNVYRALTESAVSLRYRNLSVLDDGLGNRAAGTTISFKFDLVNYLASVNGLNVQISTNSPYVQVIDNQLNLGNFSAFEIKSNVGPVRVKVLDGAPSNLEVTFTLTYSGNGGAFTDFEKFKEIVALDYLNVSVNKISTTFTSNGRVGYSKENAAGGLGFMYKDENMLYEAALMIAKSEIQVSNNARYDNNYSNDFKSLITARQTHANNIAFEAKSLFNDQSAPLPIGLEVGSRVLAHNTSDNDKYVIIEYEIKNTTNEDLTDIYPGLFVDWDMDDSSFNATEFDSEKNIAYAYAKKNADYPYAGVKLLKLESNPAYYPMSYQLPNDFLADNVFSVSEKYKTLTSGIKARGLGYDTPNGYDIMYVVGSGPYQIEKGKSIKVAYAFVAGDNLSDLKFAAEQAERTYQNLWTIEHPIIPNQLVLGQNYPNPAKSSTKIQIGLPEQTQIQFNLFDIQGKHIQQIENTTYQAGIYEFPLEVSKLKRGVYIYELKTPKIRLRKKMIVVK